MIEQGDLTSEALHFVDSLQRCHLKDHLDLLEICLYASLRYHDPKKLVSGLQKHILSDSASSETDGEYQKSPGGQQHDLRQLGS